MASGLVNAYLVAVGSIGLIAAVAAWSISRISAEASKAIARQPQAADKVKEAMFMPLIFAEGVGVVGMGFCIASFFLMR